MLFPTHCGHYCVRCSDIQSALDNQAPRGQVHGVMRILAYLLLACWASSAFSQAPGRHPEQPPSSIPQGPSGTVTIDTFLGDIGEPTRRVWGGTNPMLTNQAEIFTSDSYPQLAWELAVTGKVKVEVLVDANGIATDCRTLGPKPPPQLGGPTCALFLAQARFVPAVDRKGKPVKGVYHKTVDWQLPAIPPAPVASGVESLTFGFNSEGLNISCRRDRVSWDKPELGEPDACEMMGQVAQFMALTAPRPDWPAWELRVESHFIPGSDPYWKALGAGGDNQLLGRSGVQLTIGPDGIVRRCENTGSEMPHPMMLEIEACSKTRRLRFEASNVAERKLQLVNVMYFRRKEAASRT